MTAATEGARVGGRNGIIDVSQRGARTVFGKEKKKKLKLKNLKSLCFSGDGRNLTACLCLKANGIDAVLGQTSTQKVQRSSPAHQSHSSEIQDPD